MLDLLYFIRDKYDIKDEEDLENENKEEVLIEEELEKIQVLSTFSRLCRNFKEKIFVSFSLTDSKIRLFDEIIIDSFFDVKANLNRSQKFSSVKSNQNLKHAALME